MDAVFTKPIDEFNKQVFSSMDYKLNNTFYSKILYLLFILSKLARFVNSPKYIYPETDQFLPGLLCYSNIDWFEIN